jgi:calcineurin-like phosphoesterase family protein
MNRWFTSDLHLGHTKIIELCNRPFNSIDEMNEIIINNWNSVVKYHDVVYVLGDVALGKIAETLPMVKRLSGRKFLVPGNHDRCWSGNKKIRPVDVSRYTNVGFEISPEQSKLVMSPYAWWRLCHFPYSGDSRDDDRYLTHRPIRTNEQILLHGHVHEKWKVNDRQINVGVDVWHFTPVHEDSIREIIASI